MTRRGYEITSMSPSSRRAWIEIYAVRSCPLRSWVALLAEGVDRNGLQLAQSRNDGLSPSSRRAWIEIAIDPPAQWAGGVALLAEGVDRNMHSRPGSMPLAVVALLAEGVDRNLYYCGKRDAISASPSSRRAWIEMHFCDLCPKGQGCRSPSSRRAWIEISTTWAVFLTATVALLAEGVDRNKTTNSFLSSICQSPSSRRAWIEISLTSIRNWAVWSPSSRRAWIEILHDLHHTHCQMSPSSRRAWIEIMYQDMRINSIGVALLAEGVDRNS